MEEDGTSYTAWLGGKFFCRMVGMGTIFPARTTDNSATARNAFTTSSRGKLQKTGWAWAACAREKRNSGGCDRGQEHRQTYKFLFCIPLSSFPTHTLYCMHVPMRDCCRDKFRREIRVISPCFPFLLFLSQFLPRSRDSTRSFSEGGLSLLLPLISSRTQKRAAAGVQREGDGKFPFGH